MDRLVSILSLLLAFVAGSSGASLPRSRIVGGLPAWENRYPWITSLRSNNIHFCGGSILNRRWILTSAACLTSVQVSSTSVVTNTHFLDSGGDYYPASAFVIHPEYDAVTLARNVALVRVAMNIVFDVGVQPARLPTRAEGDGIITPMDPLRIVGWGWTSWTEPGPSNQLMQMSARTVSGFECRSYFPHYFSDEYICSFNYPRGICYGDTGGPLMYNNGTLLGVLSAFHPCGLGVPDASVRVFTHLNWIKAVTAI